MWGIKGVMEQCKFGTNWSVGPDLNVLENIILIADNKNVSTYLGWLGISIVVHNTHQILRFSGCD